MDQLRQESQLQLSKIQQQRPLPLNSLCNPHHQPNECHNPRRPTPRPDSPRNLERAVDPPPLAQLPGFDWGLLARADEHSGSSRFVGTGVAGTVFRLPSLPYPSWAPEPAKAFAVKR